MDNRTSSTTWHMFQRLNIELVGKTANGLESQNPNTVNEEEWVDFALTWDRKSGPDSEVQLRVNGVDGPLGIGAFPALPQVFGLGNVNRYRGQAADTGVCNHDILYNYMYGAVKTSAEIDAIHSDPTAMII